MTENPDPPDTPSDDDVLSSALRSIRLSGSVQFRAMLGGPWLTDPAPATTFPNVMPFHVVVQGTCWLKSGGREWTLEEGDVIALPFDNGHQLGVGTAGGMISPLNDLPPKPWRQLPVLQYGEDRPNVQILCGFLQCDALSFQPLRTALPPALHVKTKGANGSRWLRAAIEQMAAEADTPHSGGLSMLERLTEIIFIELLRHHIVAAKSHPVGWLAAMADRPLGRCLSLIHEDPKREWSIKRLATTSGVSRSALVERFQTVLDTSPMRYIRDWRLCLASVALSTGSKAIAAIAEEAGYGSEAAFNRAFVRAYGIPPATWRRNARHTAGAA